MNDSTKMLAQKAMTSAAVLPNKSVLQRAAENPAPVHQVPPIVQEVLRSSGQPLDIQTRAFMEPRFGYDFSQVRVHTNEKAANSARAVNALAYTVGKDIAFGIGQYAPETGRGQKLMAHELAHVVQQERGGVSSHAVAAAIVLGHQHCDGFLDFAAQTALHHHPLDLVPVGP